MAVERGDVMGVFPVRAMLVGLATLVVAAQSDGADTTDGVFKQFTARGHVLGFDNSGYYVSNGTYALRVSFDGGQPVEPDADGTSAGSSPDTKAAPFTRVSYSDLWPGIDVTYDAPGSGIARSTWTLEPGADPAAIRLRYNRAVRVTEAGELGIAFETGGMSESRPVAWQEVDGRRQPVAVAFARLDDDLVGFQVGAYRRDLPLTIDPTLSWNTFLGGSSIDEGNAIAVDGSGNVYVAGYSLASWGSPVRAYTSSYDAFVAKLTSAGVLTWNTFLGGSSYDEGSAIAVDGSGNVYVAGYSNTTWGSPVRAHTAVSDAFAAKLTSAGALTWNTFLGGSSYDYGNGIAVDGSSNVYVAGSSQDTWGSPVRAYTSGYDSFAAKLSSVGVLTWNTFLGGGDADQGYAITVDATSNAYVAGASSSTWGSPTRAYTSSASDGFVAKVTSVGVLIWSTFLGGSGVDTCTAIAADADGNVYVAGISQATWGSPVRAYAFDYDGFAAKLTSAGALIWNTFLGGSGYDKANAITVDASGNAYVAGESNTTWGSPLSPYTSGSDAFAAKTTSAGALAWHAFVGGVDPDDGRAIAADASGNAYLAGNSYGTWGSPVRAYTSGADAFLTRIDGDCGNGTIESGEECDDANTDPDDGCGMACQIEACWDCSGEPSICVEESNGSACTADANPCTLDQCDGAGTCDHPPGNSGALCRAAAGACDATEFCDGISATCPADASGIVATTIDAGGTVGRDASIAIGTDDLPIISYYDTTNQDLKIAACNDPACSSRTITTIDSTGDVGKCTSIVIGNDGLPLIAYYDATSQREKIAHCGDSTCSTVGLIVRTSVGASASSCYTGRRLAIGSDGFGVLSYVVVSGGSSTHRVVHCTNATCSTSGDTAVISGADFPGLSSSGAVGADGRFLMASRIAANDDLIATHCDDIACTSFTRNAVDTGIAGVSWSSVAFGNDGLALIAYEDQGNGNLKVAHCNNATCSSATLSTVDNVGNVTGQYPSLAIDSSGLGIVSHYDSTDGNLRLTRCTNANCTAGVSLPIDSTGDVGPYTSIAVTTSGRPYIAYQDVTNGDLKLAVCTNCGDEATDAGEDCDLGSSNGSGASCCDTACQYRAPGQGCRASTGVCDAAESCTGSSADCPADALELSGTLCTSDGNTCTDDQCDGVSPLCQHINNTAPCDSGDECPGDTCSSGSCQALACPTGTPTSTPSHTPITTPSVTPTVTPTTTPTSTPTLTATLPPHDSVILPLKPLSVKIGNGNTVVTKTIKVKVQNGDIVPEAETPGHTVQLIADDGDCPAGTVAALPDFNKDMAGEQDSVLLAGGKAAKAAVTLNISAAAFTTFNQAAPTRCTLSFSVTSAGNSDPAPGNNTVPMELSVFDANDSEQSEVHGTWIKSLKPLKTSIGDDKTEKLKTSKPAPGNADILPIPEDPGDLVTVTAVDGDCPPGTLGVADYDKDTLGQQNMVMVKGGTTSGGTLPVTLTATGFSTANKKSPARCTATISVTGPGGDTDATNNTTKLVIDVYDKNDF